jgi:hypothetical protein
VERRRDRLKLCRADEDEDEDENGACARVYRRRALSTRV